MTATLVSEQTRVCVRCEGVVTEEPGWFKCRCGFSFTLTLVGSDPLLQYQLVEADTPRGRPR